MTPLQHLTAAEGWLELGNVEESFAELDELPPKAQQNADVIALRVRGYHQAGKMDYGVLLAEILRNHAPDHVPSEIAYDFACHLCSDGKTKEAEEWLEVAFENVGNMDESNDLRMRALDDPSLEPLWSEIGWI